MRSETGQTTREARLNDMPSTARIVKSTAFTVDEWNAITTLMNVLKQDRFAKLSRQSLRLLADQHHIKWPVNSAD